MTINLRPQSHTISIPSCPKIVKYSPCGTRIALVMENQSRIFLSDSHTPKSFTTSLELSDEIFDFDFFPGYDPSNPITQTVLVSSRNRPIQLLRCTDPSDSSSSRLLSAYTAYSSTEEIIHPISLKFDPLTCATIIGGFPSSTIRVWDVQVPGRQIRDLVFSTKKQTVGACSIKGIVGAVDYWNSDTIVAGTYSGHVGMFDIRDKDKGMVFGAEKIFCSKRVGGVVQIMPMTNRNCIVTNHRNEEQSIRVWDIRKPEIPVIVLERPFLNHQRSSFGVWKDQYIVAGTSGGELKVYNLDDQGAIVCSSRIHPPTPVVGVDVNHHSGEIVVASGTRKFQNLHHSSSDESQCEEDKNNIQFSIDFFSLS